MDDNLALNTTDQHLPNHLVYHKDPATSAPLFEVQKIKIPNPDVTLDENLSEFDRARRTSKTWSMGQD